MTKILMPEEHHCPLGCPRSMLFIVTNQSEGVSMFGVCMYILSSVVDTVNPLFRIGGSALFRIGGSEYVRSVYVRH